MAASCPSFALLTQKATSHAAEPQLTAIALVIQVSFQTILKKRRSQVAEKMNAANLPFSLVTGQFSHTTLPSDEYVGHCPHLCMV